MPYKTLLILTVIFTLQSCHIGRYFTRNFANITDHKIFPYTPMSSSDTPFTFEAGKASLDSLRLRNEDGDMLLFDDYLAQTRTTAFLVIKNDSILFENYYRGYETSDISNIFSVSKSVTALLVGIAIDEGYIKSVHDPITDYIPELKEGAAEFQQLTIEHLLHMRSGLDFQEKYTSPFADVARLYYGTHQLKQIKNLTFKYPPNTKKQYQSVCTSILGIAIERATQQKLGHYLEQKIWQPLGMEHDASWSVDDKKHQSPKAFCCINTTARDLAKIGRLYLQKGQWQGQQIVSEAWIKKCTTPYVENSGYQYQWYSMRSFVTENNKRLSFTSEAQTKEAIRERQLTYSIPYHNEDKDEWYIKRYKEDYFANGILGQYIYVNPTNNTIIIRLGEKRDDNYLRIFSIIANNLI